MVVYLPQLWLYLLFIDYSICVRFAVLIAFNFKSSNSFYTKLQYIPVFDTYVENLNPVAATLSFYDIVHIRKS